MLMFNQAILLHSKHRWFHVSVKEKAASAVEMFVAASFRRDMAATGRNTRFVFGAWYVRGN